MQKRKKIEYKGYTAELVAYVPNDDFSNISLFLDLDKDIFEESNDKSDWHTVTRDVSLDALHIAEEGLIKSFHSIVEERIELYGKIETLKKLGYE